VVCHDGDILVPTRYARTVVDVLSRDALEAVFLQRFLFCLTSAHTDAVLSSRLVKASAPPERVRQNWKGGTLAIRSRAFADIGGFDESFVNWSGEDLEFYDRCKAIPSSRYGYVPFVHLWHAPQASKSGDERGDNLGHTQRVMARPREDRIQQLRRERRTHPASSAYKAGDPGRG
jgi:GT2 family glycosyltransferase